MDAVTEWVEGDWMMVVTGDKVRLAPRDSTGPNVEGIVADTYTPTYVQIRGLGYTQFQPANYALFVPAAPKAKLPIEPGVYTDGYGELWSLHPNGEWFSHADGSLAVQYARHEMENLPGKSVPCTRLESRADTAKAVLDRVVEILLGCGLREFPNEFSGLATEFEVTIP